MPQEFDGSEPHDNLDEPPPFFPKDHTFTEDGSASEQVEVQVEGVFQAESNGSVSRFVLLSEGDRKVPILIGAFEAQAIAHVLENERPERPLTHDLLKTIIERMEGTVVKVAIDSFWNTIYYAKVFVEHGNKILEIDSRASDAIAIGLRFDAPIFVADAILDATLDE